LQIAAGGVTFFRMNLRRTAVIASLFLAASLFAAEPFTVDRKHSEANFKIKHLMSSVTGSFNDFAGNVNIDRGNPAASSVEFTINAASIDTDDADRDKHLRSADFFDVVKYPEITFKSSKVTATGNDAYDVAGTLTMHGVSRQVTLPVAFLGWAKDPWGNERAGFEIETTLNRKDYGISWNRALDQGGFLLGNDVKVSLTIEAVKKK
jgi:polyisoprenoid-binding protein YceI